MDPMSVFLCVLLGLILQFGIGHACWTNGYWKGKNEEHRWWVEDLDDL